MTEDEIRDHLHRVYLEYMAWQAVVQQFIALGLDMNWGGNGEQLAIAIRGWGEELAQLRMHDPDPTHAANALKSARGEK